MTELQQYLTDNPQNEFVYFNAEGEWRFSPCEGWEMKTRDEVLKETEKKTNKQKIS